MLSVTFVPTGVDRPVAAGTPLVKTGDHICLVGNGLGERLQFQNEFEALLHQHFADLNLTVRNLCVPGDEPGTRIRSQNFGTPDEHLTRTSADVVVYFFGFNESFRLKKGLDPEKVLADFRRELTTVVQHTLTQSYNGQSSPRVVLVSPTAFEETGDVNLPRAADRDPGLRMITDAIGDVARETGVAFADVFTPTAALFKADERQLTLDGGQLNEVGYAEFAPILFEAILGHAPASIRVNESLLTAIDDKNFHWFNRYRCVNGYSIYGKRGEAGSDGTYRNREVMTRELEILDEMTALRDSRIWAIASGQSVPDSVDDSSTLPFIQPKSNVGGDVDAKVAFKKGDVSLRYLSTDDQLKTFDLPEGYKIQLVASEEQFPELANPVALNFDAKGRLWVSVMPSYPHWQPKSPMDDKLLILEDNDGDGAADVCKTFAGGLHQPTGFELGYGGVYVGNQQDILFLRDSDGDDVADERTRTLIGFDTADSHHGLAAFDWGPGGSLYFQEGTFKYSSIESSHGLTRLIEGGVWRFDPRTRQFGVHVNFAFANPWGFGFNHWGQDFVGDASPGNAYWAPPITGRLDFPFKHPGGSQHGRVAKEQGYTDGNVRFPTFYPKRIRPLAGCAFLSSGHFPDDVQGDYLVTNVIGDRAILRHEVTEQPADKGAGYVGREEPMLCGGGDGNFRPVDIDIAPDGSLYIIDWHNALIGHLQHNLRDPNRDTSHGRIWRITYPDRELVDSPVLADLPTADLVEYLASDSAIANQRHAYRARRQLLSRPTDDVIAAAAVMLSEIDAVDENAAHHQLEALWMHQSHNVVNEKLLRELLTHDDHRVRSAAVRSLSACMDRVVEPTGLLAELISDEHPRVRLETLRATTHAVGADWSRGQTDELIRIALRVLEMPVDGYTRYMLDEAMRRFEQVIQQRAPFLPDAGRVVAQPSLRATGMTNQRGETFVSEIGSLDTPYGFEYPDGKSGRIPVFFDLAPEIVAYQLARLPTATLLQIERDDSNRHFVPLHRELLARGDVDADNRQRALDCLIAIEKSDPPAVVLDVLENLTLRGASDTSKEAFAARSLVSMLVRMPVETLSPHRDRLTKMATDSKSPLASTGMAGLIAMGQDDLAHQLAQSGNGAAMLDWLRSLRLLPAGDTLTAQRERVVDVLKRRPSKDFVNLAIESVARMPVQWDETFALLSDLAAQNEHRSTAVKALLAVPAQHADPATSGRLAKHLVAVAERTPAKRRTTATFNDSVELVDRLLTKVPRDEARTLRQRLREIAVRLVRIKTVEEEMRYDVPFFAVEAGRPVQVILENIDGMPHNLVFTQPGKLKEVAQLGLAAGPRGGKNGKAYVPDSDLILHATPLVNSDDQAVLTFNAPTTPGEYPYVCTFPQHWYRMYGVMVVVPDLDAYNADPVPPADPIGNNRSFVEAWKSDDFDDDLTTSLRGRSPEIGKKIFVEATCASCHQVAGEGGRIGPALDSVVTKWEGKTDELLREILHPSDRIDEKYAMYLVLTDDGRTMSGLLVDENDDEVRLLANSEATEPTVIAKDEIEQMVKTKTSIMPKALMDQFTRDEVFEMLAYLNAVGANPVPVTD